MKKRFLVLLILALTIVPSALAQTRLGGSAFGRMRGAMENGAFVRMSAAADDTDPYGGLAVSTQDQFSVTDGTADDGLVITTQDQFTIPAVTAAPGIETYNAVATVTTNNVNVRSGPGYSYQAFTQVHRSSTVTVQQRLKVDSVTWYYGTVNGVTGWIHGAFLSFSAATQPPEQVSVSFTGYIRLGSTNVRSGPGMTNLVIAQLNRGAVFKVTASFTSEGTVWYFGTSGSVQGWVRGDLITTTPIATPTAAPTQAVPTSGQMTYVNYTAYVRVASAQVRAGAGSSNSLILTLPYGSQVRVLGLINTYYLNSNVSETWCYVEYTTGAYGYILETSLAAYSPTAGPNVTAAPGQNIDYSDAFVGYTAMHKVLVRTYPGGEAMQRIEYRGTQVQVKGSVWSGNVKWYLVSYYGGSGYIRSDMITTVPAGTTAPTAYPDDYENPVSFAGMTVKNKVNVRLLPSYSASVVDNLSYGTYLTVFGMRYDVSGNAWYHVMYGSGQYGYILASLVGAYDEARVKSYYASLTARPTATPTARAYTAATPDDSGSLHRYRTIAPKKTATPVPTAAPTVFYYPTSVPTAIPAALRITEMLEFSPVSLTAGQTLPVYSAPSSAAWRSDNGNATVTTNRSMWVAGFEGQWMLILYTNQNSQIRVGYVNAFRLSGALPTASTLSFAPRSARLTQSTLMTSDPLGSSEIILSLSAGSEVTVLCSCNLGSLWSYVETTINGAVVRGFVPSTAVGQ